MKPKWRDSNVKITRLESLAACIDEYGGVMFHGKFGNKHFVLNQQLRTLLSMIHHRVLSYPTPNN